MAEISAEDALRYVASRDILILLGVILVGGLLVTVAGRGVLPLHGRGTGPAVVALVAAVAVITGIALEIGGLIALVYKVVGDATDQARTE